MIKNYTVRWGCFLSIIKNPEKKNIIIALEVFVSSSDVSCHCANSQVGRSFQGSSPLMMNFDLSRLALRWAKEAKDAVKELR